MKHSSGSPSAWKLRRETYRKTSGPVSNPNDGRLRKRERRALRVPQRLYQRAWAEALVVDAARKP